VKCNDCDDIVVSRSNTEWSECACGNTKIVGKGTFKIIKGNNYTDLSTGNFDDSHVPPHKGWGKE